MEKSSLNKSLKIFFICYSIMTEIRKDAKFLRVETLGLNAGNVIIDNKGNVAIGIDALTESSSYLSTDTSILPKKTVCIGYGAGKTIDRPIPSDGTVAIGYQALNSITQGDENIAVGYHAGLKLDTGDNNTIFGWEAIGDETSTTSGDNNTCIGHKSGYNITSGDDNVFVGKSSGYTITTGSDNICIGRGADTSLNSSNQIVIGKGATGVGDNYAVIGNDNTTRVYAAEDIGATLYAGNATVQTSDRRIKKNIKDISIGLDFINKLHPVEFNKKQPSNYDDSLKHNMYWYKKNKEPRILDDDEIKKVRYGLIAQEVEPLLNNKNTNIWTEDKDTGMQHVAYAAIVAPLIKAVQELSAQVEELKTKIAELSS